MTRAVPRRGRGRSPQHRVTKAGGPSATGRRRVTSPVCVRRENANSRRRGRRGYRGGVGRRVGGSDPALRRARPGRGVQRGTAAPTAAGTRSCSQRVLGLPSPGKAASSSRLREAGTRTPGAARPPDARPRERSVGSASMNRKVKPWTAEESDGNVGPEVPAVPAPARAQGTGRPASAGKAGTRGGGGDSTAARQATGFARLVRGDAKRDAGPVPCP